MYDGVTKIRSRQDWSEVMGEGFSVGSPDLWLGMAKCPGLLMILNYPLPCTHLPSRYPLRVSLGPALCQVRGHFSTFAVSHETPRPVEESDTLVRTLRDMQWERAGRKAGFTEGP